MAETRVPPVTWRFRTHDGRVAPGSVFHDARGTVTVVLSYTTFDGSGRFGGVVYRRARRGPFQVGLRGWTRDFKTGKSTTLIQQVPSDG